MTGGVPERGGFCTTRWSVVLAAGRPDSPDSAAALEALCVAYWYPLYAFVRRRGHGEEEARDLTQGFFQHLLQHEGLRHVARDRGRFRAFLLAGIRNFLANDWDHAHRQKRGGGATVFSLDAADPEDRYRLEPVDNSTPEQCFERRWAHTVLRRVIARMEGEQDTADRRLRFATLRPYLLRQPPGEGYAEAAERLGLSLSAVTSAIHRMRLRFREMFRAEIAHTVADPADVDAEIRHLIQALGQPEPPPENATDPG
ncbi:MAG: sigma-70 family RNA polymerase sigma factor [Verrucomicrobiae bacterium]|nr:sigma-70 family RNA polymerase sigma factor [Verrucomicrobiae bacterium]